jgi:glycosyltransferase involved in cell wall biosynthesis
MKILMCHNYYQQRGGEDTSFDAECQLLRDNGHQVITYTRHNDDIQNTNRIATAFNTVWNRNSFHEVTTLIKKHRPDILHATNTFPLLSPASLFAAKKQNVPVVLALRNYRLICPKGVLLKDNKVCHECVGKIFATPAVRNRCYRDSRSGSLVVASMLTIHKLMNSWNRAVTRYFTLTQFAKQTFVDAGFDADKISVKPNFVGTYFQPAARSEIKHEAVFVGRLAEEKGIRSMLESWKTVPRDFTLKVIGDGPLEHLVREAADRESNIKFIGRLDLAGSLEAIRCAEMLIMPSIWYETFGRTIIEAYSVGTPVVVSRMGAMQELVNEGSTGVLFEPGNPHDLSRTVNSLLDTPDRLFAMRSAARREYERSYTAETNYHLLMSLYEQTISEHQRTSKKLELADGTARTRNRAGLATSSVVSSD